MFNVSIKLKQILQKYDTGYLVLLLLMNEVRVVMCKTDRAACGRARDERVGHEAAAPGSSAACSSGRGAAAAAAQTAVAAATWPVSASRRPRTRPSRRACPRRSCSRLEDCGRRSDDRYAAPRPAPRALRSPPARPPTPRARRPPTRSRFVFNF